MSLTKVFFVCSFFKYQCQDNLIQFGAFLTIQLSTHDYQASLPSLDEFHDTYSITPDVSFFLTRPVYRFDIQVSFVSFTDIFVLPETMF